MDDPHAGRLERDARHLLRGIDNDHEHDHDRPHTLRAPTNPEDRSTTPFQTQDAAVGICRICRGEGTATEPLFYPCKCSGSIKYVHQDCLMEWLSHSQKKYCELCKTSFRFTKLYASEMPQSLPVHVFLEHMAKYLIRNMLVWLRAAVTISVWVCWLPYFMRSVWSFTFWASDEGFGGNSILSNLNKTNSGEYIAFSTAVTASGSMCPASPLFASDTTSVAEAETLREILGAKDIPRLLMNLFLSSIGMPTSVSRSELREYGVSDNASASPDASQTIISPSLLSDVGFLRNLTRLPALNRTIISMLEGQIITVLVIVCFILVILVRDYVVQQQPEINMRAAFAEPENDEVGAQQQPEPAPGHHELEVQNDGEPIIPHSPFDSDEDHVTEEPSRHRPRGRTVQSRHMGEDTRPIEIPEGFFDTQVQPTGPGFPEIDAVGGHRPQPPPYSSTEEERESLLEFLRIYNQADGNPEFILDIVEYQGLEHKLRHWVDARQRSVRNAGEADAALLGFARSSSPVNEFRPSTSQSVEDGSSSAAFTPLSSDEQSQNGSAGSVRRDEGEAEGKGKGKERAWLPTPLDQSPRAASPSPGPSRPRAVSDGPQPQSSANPLGNNSWSFAALPSNIDDDDLPGSKLPTIPEPSPLSGRLTPESSTIAETDVPSPAHATAVGDSLSSAVDDMDRPHTDPERPLDEATGRADDLARNEVPDIDADAAINGEVVPPGLVGRFTNFMWGDLDRQQADPVDDNPAAEEQVQDDPWIDVAVGEGAEDIFDPGVEEMDAGAADAMLNREAMEDMEDFEGVMELIGMRGPIAGLFQNAIFCAVLVSVTIFAGVFIPYNLGRVSLWILAHPMRLVRVLFELFKLLQDVTIMVGGLASWCTLNIVDMLAGLVGGGLQNQVVLARKACWVFWISARGRVFEYVFLDFPMSASEMQNFSAISHEALNSFKGGFSAVFFTIDQCLSAASAAGFIPTCVSLVMGVGTAAKAVAGGLVALSALLLSPGSWIIDLSEPEQQSPLDPELAYWSGGDRFWAILAGYVSAFVMGAMYLKRGSPFSSGTMMQAWEAGIMDTLHQASGIMKVILIISIEMLAFPLYCGLLLDAALLPLFEDATFKSRMLFTYNYPLTSTFVHWFVGTGYMFHFALFVSMCRKIMRPGVLYFIRDPDDPEFHPVRDVLERNLTTQLRKILFSAFVYGALVIVCLGGVVWGLSFTVPGVLPIHYSSNEPVLEFPVDLLFYNFLMPLAVKFFKPGDGLHTMYTWWFRKCARGLRLTYFLFGERRIDEEGTLHLRHDSADSKSPYQRLLLELDENNKVVPKTWRDTFEGGTAKPNPPLSRAEMRLQRHRKANLLETDQLVKDGRFVRAPASDRIKIPKGTKVFLTVSERGHRKDGNPDNDLYASNQYQIVYIPPNFRTRTFLFILFMWMFAAFTGVAFTIGPLVFGRIAFKALLPAHIRTNDIYAFSIGIYLLGSIAYSIFHLRSMVAKVREWVGRARGDVVGKGVASRTFAMCLRGAQLCYAYSFLVIIFPLLASTMMELYLTIPLHTYMNPTTVTTVEGTQAGDGQASRPTIRVIQGWTLGLLYVKLGSKMIISLMPESRAAVAVRTVMRRGWLRPDISVLTRAFILPILALAFAGISGPPMAVRFLLDYNFIARAKPNLEAAAEAARLATIYRQSYPIAAFAALLLRNAVGMVSVFHGWTAGIRDEAYLIGERLHNFGAAAGGAKKTRKAWRSGGARL